GVGPGRAAARGGLRDAPRTVIQAFRIEEEPLRHETFYGRLPQGPVAPPGRWLCQRPPLFSRGRGIKMSNLQCKRLEAACTLAALTNSTV
ncbi:MAG: hypothetical protein L0312_16440, partial [Acidobacteria bacterium]|nr:hypothetical protein [Acidobacteriota bacterium]